MLGVCSYATNECLVEAHFTLTSYFSELQSTVSAHALPQLQWFRRQFEI